jgi:hypothetical protein
MKFKIQPAWIVTIDIFIIPLLYAFLISTANSKIDLLLAVKALFTILIMWIVLPLNFKMIKGAPLIILNKDYLIDNLGGHAIKWCDISEIKLIESSFLAFDKLIINLRRPDEYFNTPVKRLSYKFRQLFIANDLGIFINFVSGESNEITQVINAYWSNYAESEENIKTPHAP